jgi:hypothetical protein
MLQLHPLDLRLCFVKPVQPDQVLGDGTNHLGITRVRSFG